MPHNFKSIDSIDSNEDQLQEFLESINALIQLIKENQFNLAGIPGMISTLDQGLLLEILTKIAEDSNIYGQLLNLDPGGEPLKVKKNARDTLTFRVFRTPSGKYKLSLSLKRNRIDLTKRKMDFESGLDKERKITLVFPEDEPLYAELLVDFASKAEKDAILAEVEMHNLLKLNKGFAPLLYAGADINPSTGKKTIVLLAPFKSTLDNFLSRNWLPDGYDPSDINQNKKITAELILQLLEIVQVMHNEKIEIGPRNVVTGIEHKDLKPLNFLIDISQNGAPILQVTDLNTMTVFGSPEEIYGTIEYMPPWLLLMRLRRIITADGKEVSGIGKTVAELEQIFEKLGKDRILNSYAWHLIKQQFGDQPLIDPGHLEVQGKHDVWAVGCIIIRMKYGIYLNDPKAVSGIIAQDPLLQRIFQFDQADIPDIEEVINLYLTSEYYKSAELLPEVKLQPRKSQDLEKNWLDKPSTLLDFVLLKTTRRAHVAEYITLLYSGSPFDKMTLFVDAKTRAKLNIALRKIINGNHRYSVLENNIKIIANARRELVNSFHREHPTSTDEQWGNFKKNEILFDMVEYLLIQRMLVFLDKQKQKNAKPSLFFPAKEPHYEFSPQAIRAKVEKLTDDLNYIRAKIDKFGPAIKESLGPKSFVKLYGLRS